MIQVVQEFVVRENADQRFVLVFGPGGAWSNLFSGAPGFRGTTLLRETNHLGRFLVIDIWDSAAQREEFLDEHSDARSQLDTLFAEFVERRMELGVFQIIAEATVRASQRSRQRTRRR